MTIRNTDAFILSCFAEDVRAIPGIHQRTPRSAGRWSPCDSLP
jgi:hypothetical protein